MGSSLHSQLLAPSAATPPVSTSARGAQGCRLLQFCSPTAASNFPKFLYLSASKQLLSSSLSFFPPPSHTPAPSTQVLTTPHIPAPLPPLSQEHTQLQATAASAFPHRDAPCLGTLTPAPSIQQSPQTRNGNQPGPCLLREREERVLVRAVRSRRAAGGERVPLAEGTSGAGERAAGLQKPQEGLSAGEDMPMCQLCPGHAAWQLDK